MRVRFISKKDDTTDHLMSTVLSALEDLKALDIKNIDVRKTSTITDFMIIASGRSDRQVKAIAEKVIASAKAIGQRPLGIEGRQQGEWILVDMGDVILHVMHPTTRAYYQLEKLWEAHHEDGSISDTSSQTSV